MHDDDVQNNNLLESAHGYFPLDMLLPTIYKMAHISWLLPTAEVTSHCGDYFALQKLLPTRYGKKFAVAIEVT